MDERLLLTFTGPDRPGITAQLAAVLGREGARLHDVEQVVVQGFLTLAFSVSFAAEAAEQRCIKELLFAAKGLGLGTEYRRWAPGAEEPRQLFALTAIARSLGPEHLLAVADAL